MSNTFYIILKKHLQYFSPLTFSGSRKHNRQEGRNCETFPRRGKLLLCGTLKWLKKSSLKQTSEGVRKVLKRLAIYWTLKLLVSLVKFSLWRNKEQNSFLLFLLINWIWKIYYVIMKHTVNRKEKASRLLLPSQSRIYCSIKSILIHSTKKASRYF